MGGVALARGNFGPFSLYLEFPNYPSLENVCWRTGKPFPGCNKLKIALGNTCESEVTNIMVVFTIESFKILRRRIGPNFS